MTSSAMAARPANWTVESMPTSLEDEHAAIVGVCIALAVAVVVAIGAAALVRREGVRLSWLVTGLAACAVVTVGVVAWVVTFVEARAALHEKSERLLQLTMDLVDLMAADLAVGPELLAMMASLQEARLVDWETPFPTPFRGLHAVHASFRRPAVSLVYMGLADGRMQGLSSSYVLIGAAATAAANTTAALAAGGCPVRCPAQDLWDAATCRAANATNGGCNATMQEACAGFCGRPPAASWCEVPNAGAAASDPVMYPLSAARFRDSYNLDCTDAVSFRVDYDARSRPWYKHALAVASDGAMWGDPYPFHNAGSTSIDVGFTCTKLYLSPDTGALRGVFAVDYTLETLATTLRRLPPTPNAVVLLAMPDGALLSSSMSAAALTADLGVNVSTEVANITGGGVSARSEIRRVAAVIQEYFGSLEAAMGERALLVDGDTLVTVSSLQMPGGLELLSVLYLPYGDLLGATHAASTTALLLVVGTCVVFALVLAGFVRETLVSLGELAEGFEHIAWMNLSSVKPLSHSRVYELQWMGSSFRKMTANLEEFRRYMPNAILSGSVSNLGDGQQREVAIVFTDIRSSTVLWESCPDAMAPALKLHNGIIRERIIEMDGLEVKTVGDAFMVAFTDPTDACMFACLVLEDLVRAEWPEELVKVPAARRTDDGAWNGINIRVGINFGDCEVVMNGTGSIKLDFFGPTVNVAARVEATGLPGSVCITDAVMRAVDLNDIGRPAVMDMGVVDLKGVSDGVKLYTLVPNALEARLPELLACINERGASSPTSHPGHCLPEAVDLRRLSSSGLHRHPTGHHLGSHLDPQLLVLGKTLLRRAGLEPLPPAYKLDSVNAALEAVMTALRETHGSTLAVVGEAVVHQWAEPRMHARTRGSFEYVATVTARLAACDPACGVTARAGLCSARVLVGNVCGGDARFATVVGPAVALADILGEAACELGCAGLYTALGRDAAQTYASLAASLRPVDVWTVRDAPEESMTIYQVSQRMRDLERGLSTPASQSLGQPPAMIVTDVDAPCDEAGAAAQAWSKEGWWRAFAASELHTLPDAVFFKDPVAQRVREMEASGTHIRPMPISNVLMA
eukprot:TRINITY_DN7089_c0_g1_i1.p1 TRINITY_DN7089_c0_g1~~TRINITY_DN7089_c0_g1_i1.p1  ORF type:complete len:1088 (+),score=328.75 TRINITY_DN7089_c0_g1_i1:87-3350(+)